MHLASGHVQCIFVNRLRLALCFGAPAQIVLAPTRARVRVVIVWWVPDYMNFCHARRRELVLRQQTEFNRCRVGRGLCVTGDGVDEVRGGTRAYLAPESSDGEIMRASMDVWALGIIFFQLLAVHSRAPTDATVSQG